MTAYALTLCGVSAGRALTEVSLAVVPGEVAGVIGPAGAGKTALLRVAAGLLSPDTGDVRVEDLPVTSPAARRLVGYAAEAPAFPPALTVREVLSYCGRLHAAGNGAAGHNWVREALAVAGLSGVAHLRAGALDQTDARRLALAQAMLGGRRVLLLDETLSGLDPVARRDLGDRVARLAATGVAVLLAARDAAALERIAARVLVLRAGRIVRAGTLTTLLRERVLEVILDRPPAVAPPGFRITAAGIEAPLAGRTAEAALALCRAHRLAVRATRVRIKSLEEVVLDAHDAPP